MNEIIVAAIGAISIGIDAMIQSRRKTGKIRWEENKQDRPDYKVWYKEKVKHCKKVWHSNSQLKKECIAGLK